MADGFGRLWLRAIGVASLLLSFAGAAKAGDIRDYLPAWNASDSFQFYSPLEAKNWKLGFYEGVYEKGRLRTLMYDPIAGHVQPEVMLAGNAVYKAMTLPYLPVDIELDFVGALHVGAEPVFGEIAAAPTFRWKWFPWNNYVYTTYRLGVVGASYTTAESSFERLETLHLHTAQFLNFWVSEITAAPSPDSRWETFLRVHHRSGIYGTINGVTGGSNYVGVGLRVRQ